MLEQAGARLASRTGSRKRCVPPPRPEGAVPEVMHCVVKVLSGYGRGRRNFVSLPRVTALLDEPGVKYFVLPDEPAPATPEPGTPERSGPLPR